MTSRPRQVVRTGCELPRNSQRNIGQCRWNALCAAGWVIIPAPPEILSLHKLPRVDHVVQHVRVLNPQLTILGYLVNRKRGNLNLHSFYEEKLRNLYGERVFQNCIHELTEYGHAVSAQQPISFFKPKSAAARSIQKLAEEIEQRIKQHEERQHENEQPQEIAASG